MSITLRPYQQTLIDKVYSEWSRGRKTVLLQLSTGGGKTVTLARVVHENSGTSCVIVHRQELVGQICIALSREGLRYRLIAPKNVIRTIVAAELTELGISRFDPTATCVVAGVDTLIRRDEPWMRGVTLWIIDECHHAIGNAQVTPNKWGSAIALFPASARGLGVTATPLRADGLGLGLHADGPFESMVEGPPMRWLIENGYLTGYDIACVKSDIDMAKVRIAAGGDFNLSDLREASARSHIVGDVVENYQKFAPGKLAVVFATDVKAAQNMADNFVEHGFPAKCLHGAMPGDERAIAIRDFRAGRLKVICSCDIISEGFDLPAVEVAIFARPTASYGLYVQQFGRALRPMPGKDRALIIDHVGNVLRHDGPPDVPRVWTLDRYSRRSAPGETVPYRVCANPGYVLADPGGLPWAAYRDAGLSNADMLAAGLLVDRGIPCAAPYERVHTLCPYCGFFPEPATRSTPEAVEGELQLLDAETLAALYAEIPPTMDEFRAAQTMGLPHMVAQRHRNDHAARLGELERLKHVMMWWGGYWSAHGHTDAMVQRRFWHTFGIDVLTAQALKRADAEALRGRIEAKSAIDGIVIPQYSEPN